ncbi:hypothetical protein ACHAPJ_010121 [Fusarium lateritium]
MLFPREHETPFNKAPLIRAIAALLMVIAILSAITRLVTRLATIRTLMTDDILVAASMIVAIAQSIAVISQGANGMGELHGSSNSQISSIMKAQYASDALFILVLLLAKISATRTIWGMAPRNRRKMILATEGLIGAWAISSIVASFLQCSLPEPWDYINGQCFNRPAFWAYIDAMNIFTDLAITFILVQLFIHLKTSTAKKTLRAIESQNPMFDMWKPTVIVQIIQCMSVMATCIPYLKPFLDSLESGQMIAGDLRGVSSKGSNSRSRSGGYATGDTSRHKNTTSRGLRSVTTMATNASHRRQDYEMMDMERSSHRMNKTNVTAAAEQNGSWDGQSHTSQTVLVEQTWQVDVHRKNSSAPDA